MILQAITLLLSCRLITFIQIVVAQIIHTDLNQQTIVILISEAKIQIQKWFSLENIIFASKLPTRKSYTFENLCIFSGKSNNKQEQKQTPKNKLINEQTKHLWALLWKIFPILRKLCNNTFYIWWQKSICIAM